MPLEPGSILNDRYRIESQLGKGGMGAVYLAYDQTLGIRVALKENLNLNPESERQFWREANLLASLRHPNLPRVTDYFILEGRQYLVMDYIEGEDLHSLAEREPPSVEEILEWADAMCDALSYLHSRPQPVIHRDIKPPNLKLQPDGNVVLVDFGIAKAYDQAQTTTGARGLTPGYSPPEQYGAQRTDARSDQYSLAATLYELFTSQRPVDSIERMLQKKQLPGVRELNPGVPEHVSAAIERAMELEKDARFPDIRSFRDALQGKLDAATIRADALTQVTEPEGRRWGMVLGAGFLALLLLGGGAYLATGGDFLGLLPSPKNTASPTSPPVVAAIATETLTPSPTEPPPIPSSTWTPSPSPSPTVSPTPTAQPVVIGGGGRIAFSSDRESGILQIWSMFPDGSDLRQITFGPGDKTYPKFSPDGEKLIYAAPGGTDDFGNDLGLDLWLINVDGTGGVVNLTQYVEDDFDAVWSPDGDMIAFTSTRVGGLRQVFLQEISCQPAPGLCQMEGEALNFSFHEDFSAVEYSPDWSYDGETIVVAGSINQAPGRLLLRPPATEVPTYFDRRDAIIGADHPAWSPDRQSLVFTYQYQRGIQEIYIAPMESPSYFLEKLTNSLGNKEPDFSPNGQYIVFTSTRDQNPEIYLMTINGTGQTNLSTHPGRDLNPDWGPAR